MALYRVKDLKWQSTDSIESIQQLRCSWSVSSDSGLRRAHQTLLRSTHGMSIMNYCALSIKSRLANRIAQNLAWPVPMYGDTCFQMELY